MRPADSERLRYADGERLTAAELAAEQDYHLRTRRLLTRVLSRPGVAAGLDVAIAADPRRVRVSPGLAIDDEGRAILLDEPRELDAARGYLVIGYGERVVAHGSPARGPLRLLQEPRLHWCAVWPEDHLVVLAAVELAVDCSVRALHTDIRARAVVPQAPRGSGLAVEGEQEIDQRNPAKITFHLRGPAPTTAVLHLRGATFPSLHYTAMGRHTHEIAVVTSPATMALGHVHSLAAGTTTPEGEHRHRLRIEQNPQGIDEHSGNLGWSNHIMRFDGHHRHFVGGGTEPALGVWKHDHTAPATVGDAGATDIRARDGKALGFPDGLRVAVDSADLTDRIIGQLRDRDGDLAWPRLGTGTGDADDRLATRGTGEIDLVRLGVDVSAGEHRIVLSVPSGGGTVGYNLYAE